MPHVPTLISASPEVSAALRRGGPVVALESTILAHGLPAPSNRAAADAIQAAVREQGAVPATVAVLDTDTRRITLEKW